MSMLNLPGLGKSTAYVGTTISQAHFGANFLFDRDGGQDAGSISDPYAAFAEKTGLGNLRYPGGTLTETRLDLANPNALNQDFMGKDTNSREPTVGVSDFLDYAKKIGASANFVLPTYRFLNTDPDQSGHRQVNAGQEAALRSFVNFVLTDAFSKGVKIDAFELGNEWYVDNSDTFGFSMSPVEYGRVAAYLAVVVESEIKGFNAGLPAVQKVNPDIVVQVGPGGNAEWYAASGHERPEAYCGTLASATNLIFEQFKSMESRAAVDGILMHRYLEGGDCDINGWSYSAFSRWTKLAAATPGFSKPNLYVTEWNVSSRNTAQLGLNQVDSMVELVEEMAIAGVGHANVWAVQQNNKT